IFTRTDMTAGFTLAIRSAKSAGCWTDSAACTWLDQDGSETCRKPLGPPSSTASATPATDPISTRRRADMRRRGAGPEVLNSFIVLSLKSLLQQRAGRASLARIIGES